MNAIIRPSVSKWLTFDQIDFPANARPTNATDVVALVSSIRTIGLQVPLTVVERGGRYLLIAGRHRLEALRVIGEERVPVRVVDFDDIEARLWRISENLHRTELSALARSEQIVEFAKLTKGRLEAQKQAPVEPAPARPDPVQEYIKMGGKMPDANREEVSAQFAPKPQGGRPESGDRLVARRHHHFIAKPTNLAAGPDPGGHSPEARTIQDFSRERRYDDAQRAPRSS
jgi:ParB-like nuclease domain